MKYCLFCAVLVQRGRYILLNGGESLRVDVVLDFAGVGFGGLGGLMGGKMKFPF